MVKFKEYKTTLVNWSSSS